MSAAQAAFTPQLDKDHRVYGFSLATAARSRHGFWRGKTLLFCSGSNNERASAEAEAHGRVNLTFSTNQQISDRLIIRVSGSSAKQAKFHILDISNHDLPTKELSEARGLIADLPHPGPYTLVADLGVATEGDQAASANAEIAVQSLRDALALGYSSSGLGPDFRIELPVIVPSSEILDALKHKLLDKNGHYFPCKPEEGCDRRAKDIYLENFELVQKGAWLTVKGHFAGNIHDWIFDPGITGDILLYGTPQINGDIFSISGVQVEVNSRNELVKIAGPSIIPHLEDVIREKATYNVRPLLQKVLDEANKSFPIPLGPACLSLDVKSIEFKSIEPWDSPQGYIARFSVEVTPLNIDQCRPGTPRTQFTYPLNLD